MIKYICILTKSYKHGGYCVAGIDINSKQRIRLVTSEDPNSDEVKKEQMYINGKPIECLDIIEYDLIKNIPHSCQTENWLINANYKPKFIKNITIEELIKLVKLDRDKNFICNNSNFLDVNEISSVDRSLFIYHVKNLKIEATTVELFGELRFKYKCSFEYNNINYTNVSLTDPVYRDISQDGLNIIDALIISSLPCIPYNNDSYYKFVAKIFPINAQMVANIEELYKKESLTNEVIIKERTTSMFIKNDLVINTYQNPGVVLFENYDELKQIISQGVSNYEKLEYSIENYQTVVKHYNELKQVKKSLEKAKKDLIKNYNAPLNIVEKKLDELIDLVKIPFKKADNFIKQNKTISKKYNIYIFSKNVAISNGLQEHMDKIFRSPAFFDARWLNSSCSDTKWQTEVTLKIKTAANDIEQILLMKSEDASIILAQYYQTLSMKKAKEFLSALKATKNITEKSIPNNYIEIIDINQITNNNSAGLSINSNDNSDDIKNNATATNNITEKVIANNNLDIIEINQNPNNNSAGLSINSNENSDDINSFQDFYVLNCIANAVNPYTGEIITGIDNTLKTKLFEIAKKLCIQ